MLKSVDSRGKVGEKNQGNNSNHITLNLITKEGKQIGSFRRVSATIYILPFDRNKLSFYEPG